MADYVTTEQVAFLAHEFDTATDRAALLVTAASRLFDNLTVQRENFYQQADPTTPTVYTTRTFYGNGTGYLQLDPYTALNPVNPVVVDADYTYEIPTYIEKDGMLVVYSTYLGRRTGWADGVSIAVSANWGFAEIPADVTLACAHIALHLWRTADPAFAVISNAEGAATRPLTLPRIARDVIDTYKGKYLSGFAFV
jgi:hypothetical protein